MRYLDKPSNYDKYPVVAIPEHTTCQRGWESILHEIKTRLNTVSKAQQTVVIECYQGVLDHEVETAFRQAFGQAKHIHSVAAMRSEDELYALFKDDVTDDELFGYLTRYQIDAYFDPTKVAIIRRELDEIKQGLVVVYGTGAAWLRPVWDILVYVDMARWEIQMRFRRNDVSNVGIHNQQERASLQYKRGFFVDWRICDRFKKKLMKQCDYVLDTNTAGDPKMITGATWLAGLQAAVQRPFRVVPFFDPGPWGGQWMKEVCDLDRESDNYAWCFDCVPEENSLLIGIGATRFETPAINVVFAHPRALLGEPVYGRFGDEFPIRFDLLDTMQGGNLSLQVHPLTEYIQEKFGMPYTQDESYYLLDAEPEAVVYAGLKEGICPEAMIRALEAAQETGFFDANKYVGCYGVKKHDHVLFPAGTVHCSGKEALVLEISATPYIFTFKLWDWGRLGLDGRPRPINITHGKNVIQWNRTETWVRNEILNQTRLVAEGDGWLEEHTGLHQQEFIETRRHWFSKTVLHNTNGCVQVLNLVEGREAMVESPTNAFEPYVVHYAETFIIPGCIGAYTIRPHGESEGKQCATIKAYVRNSS